MASLNLEHIRPLQRQVLDHPIYDALESAEDLRVFMAHHLFAAWDYMSLVKYLQDRIAPARVPWMPTGDPGPRSLINRLVADEESGIFDEAGAPSGSHFEQYCRAMDEVGADKAMSRRFLDRVAEQGIDAALYSDLVPLPARYFTETSFCFIREDKPHVVAAALAFGRENLVPEMFRKFRDGSRIGDKAPRFHDYLDRHLGPEAGYRGPLSLELVKVLCGGDPRLIEEAETAAEEAICARLRLWDGTLEAIRGARQAEGQHPPR